MALRFYHNQINNNELQHAQQLTSLDLHEIVINDETVQVLSDNLSQSTTITHLSLEACRISDQGFQILSNALQQNTTLTGLSLVAQELNFERIQILSEVLSKRHHALAGVLDLDLKYNHFGDTTVKVLSPILDKLRSLDLTFTGVFNEGLIALSDKLLHNTSLQRLNLSANNLDFPGIDALSNTLKHNKTLLELNLNNTYLDNKSIMTLFDGLSCNRTLTSLDIGHCLRINPFFEEVPRSSLLIWTILSDFISHNKSLTFLGLEGLSGEKGIEIDLSHALVQNKTLLRLNLKSNRIGKQKFHDILKGLC